MSAMTVARHGLFITFLYVRHARTFVVKHQELESVPLHGTLTPGSQESVKIVIVYFVLP